MNIGIDIRAYSKDKISGVETYILNLLHSIFTLDKDNQYYLFYNGIKGGELKELFQYPNAHFIHSRIPNKFFNLSLSLLRYPKIDNIIKKRGNVEKLDILFVPDPRPSPVSNECKKVMTFHDLSFEHFSHTFNLKTRWWHKVLRPKKEAQESTHIFAVSNFTKNDIHKTYSIPTNKIKVLYEGVPSYMKRTINNDRFAQICDKYNLPKDFFISISTIEPRKNILKLVRAFLWWLRKGNKGNLVIAGKIQPSIFAKLDLEVFRNHENIHFCGFIDEKDKSILLSHSKGLFFPSLYEGFGLPVLEALSCGVPVLTSKNSPMVEIAGEYGVYVDPDRVASIVEGINKIQHNCVSSDVFIQQAKKFSWDAAAKKLLEVFHV